MENNETVKTPIDATEKTIKRASSPTVQFQARVIKRGETGLFVEQTNDGHKLNGFDEPALFLINIARKNESAKDIKEGVTYDFLTNLSADLDRKTRQVECRYGLRKFKQSEF